MARKHTLDTSDITTINSIIDEITPLFNSVDDGDFLDNICLYAHRLPFELRKSLNHFRLADEKSDYIVVSGYPLDDTSIGPTPPHWDNRTDVSPTLREEIYMILVGHLLGDIFGWATQQGGYVCHDLLPVRGLEKEQTGASSDCVLAWHTEDAFHRYRGDYVGLMCLRNPDRTATTVGGLDLSLLPNDVTDVLFEPRFAFRRDLSHQPEFSGRDTFWSAREKRRLKQIYAAMDNEERHPPKVPVLSGRRDSPTICIDPVFIDHPADDSAAAAALAALAQALDKNLCDVVLQPGDLVFLDNARVIHGRQPFSARYDGTDRWLKRINLTTDLRKSHAVRGGESQRLVF
jgi:Fe(II)/alpha-ketoglutarate-dependent arginine beta-hydroxylase